MLGYVRGGAGSSARDHCCSTFFHGGAARGGDTLHRQNGETLKKEGDMGGKEGEGTDRKNRWTAVGGGSDVVGNTVR